MDGLIELIKYKTNNHSNIDIMEQVIEIEGKDTSVATHINEYTSKLSPLKQIELIKYALENQVHIDQLTLQYESLSTICSELIISLSIKNKEVNYSRTTHYQQL